MRPRSGCDCSTITTPGPCRARREARRQSQLAERLPFAPETFPPLAGVHSSDGKRFLVARYASEAVVEPIRLIRSWRRVVEK